MSPAITLEGVTKRYGDLTAVDAVDLEVPEGSLCGFLGPNGAGKSTTIRMIMSIIYPDEGRISVMGGSALDRKDDIGYLPEERGLYRKMRVVEL
ncbi:MAG: ATP-binding cassette domain-containing protein, partial [Planctomycetota bacterium]|nr:ATP-binding cassette domain-containing protein [Planctomycetota bacterium]